MAEWDDEVDELYGLDPGEFVAARNALAKQIKAGGDKARGAEVAKLPRPTIVAWAVNQAARRDPEQVTALVDAAERVATAQSDLMAGGEPAELRAATTAQRAAAAELVHAAVGLAGATHADSIRNTLDAAIARPELTGRLTSGTLTDTLDAPAGFGFGFDTVATVTDLDSRRRSRAAARRASADPAPKAAPTDEDRAAAKAAVAAATRAVAALEKELAKVEKTTARRTTALEAAEQEVADAEAALVEAQRSVDDATENRDDAGRELDAQRGEQERVAAELDQARAILDELG